MKVVTVTVTNVDEAGTLTLSTLQPVDGIDGDGYAHRYRWGRHRYCLEVGQVPQP